MPIAGLPVLLGTSNFTLATNGGWVALHFAVPAEAWEEQGESQVLTVRGQMLNATGATILTALFLGTDGETPTLFGMVYGPKWNLGRSDSIRYDVEIIAVTVVVDNTAPITGTVRAGAGKGSIGGDVVSLAGDGGFLAFHKESETGVDQYNVKVRDTRPAPIGSVRSTGEVEISATTSGTSMFHASLFTASTVAGVGIVRLTDTQDGITATGGFEAGPAGSGSTRLAAVGSGTSWEILAEYEARSPDANAVLTFSSVAVPWPGADDAGMDHAVSEF